MIIPRGQYEVLWGHREGNHSLHLELKILARESWVCPAFKGWEGGGFHRMDGACPTEAHQQSRKARGRKFSHLLNRRQQ